MFVVRPTLQQTVTMTSEFTRSSLDLDIIPEEELIAAVASMCAELNLSSGNSPGFNLYHLMRVYFKDPDRRQRINEIVEEKSV